MTSNGVEDQFIDLGTETVRITALAAFTPVPRMRACMGQTPEVRIQTRLRSRRSTYTALRPAAPLAAATLDGLFHGVRLLAAALLLAGLLLTTRQLAQ